MGRRRRLFSADVPLVCGVSTTSSRVFVDRLVPGTARFHSVLLGFTGFFFASISPSFVRLTEFFHDVRPTGPICTDLIRFYWVLLGFTGFYLVLLGFTGFYWVLLGFTRFN